MSLKYLFKVDYKDGTAFNQNKDDVSETDPKKSAFYDVLQSKKDIKKFTLKRYLERYSVDLTTGGFNINGVNVTVDTDKPIPLIKDHTPELKLIFYRQHKQSMNINFNIGTKKISKMEPQADEVTYFIGFETVILKKKYTRLIGIK